MAKLEILQADYKTLSRTVILCNERKDVFLCLFSGLEKRCFQTSSAPMMSRTELYP